MPRGYPDYFGRAMFPKYGTGLVANHLITNHLLEREVTMFSIAGKGRLYYGWLYSYNITDTGAISISIEVDGTEIFDEVLTTFRDRHFQQINITPVFLVMYKTVLKQFVFGFSGDITFEQTYVVKVDNRLATTIHHDGVLYYAEVK